MILFHRHIIKWLCPPLQIQFILMNLYFNLSLFSKIDRSALCLIQRAKIIQANIKNTSFV